MGKTAKVAISLPEQVLKAVEKQRKARGVSRSEFFREAVERLLKQEQESKAIESYVQGYRELPESEDEIKQIHETGRTVLSEEPW
jgi:metal-responsive CopG/Arc/MetJ family transcriptional regulator